jgi:hypothetical protein
MKYLKLDSQFESARKLAECLIGSECIYEGLASNLRGIIGNWFIVDDTDDYTSFTHESIIKIAVDALKLCPFMAMKNGISVLSYMEDFWLVGGLISEIQNSSDVSIQIGRDGILYACDFDNITLDLEKLPEGVELVEL